MIKASRLFLTILLSLVIVGLFAVFVYHSDLRPMHLSDTFFFVGLVLFFPGLISIIGAMEIFSAPRYLLSKTFSRNIEGRQHFKSFADYKEFKETNPKKGCKLVEMLIVGLVYIIISIILSYC